MRSTPTSTTSTHRRAFLKTTGASIAAFSVGSSPVAAGEPRRFVVDRRGLRSERDLEVIHELDPVDLLVVEATEERLDETNAAHAPDRRYSPGVPDVAPERDSHVEYPPEGEDLTGYQWDKQDQRVAAAHEVTRGEDTRVAIIDSGVAAGHPDLEHAVDADLSRNFTTDDYGVPGPYAGAHGSHVAGIVAANDDGTGVVGTAPATELVDLRVFSPFSWPGLEAWMGNVLAAIVYSAEIGADAANLSLGWTFLFRDGWGRFWGEAMQRVGTFANREGTVLTHACGNWGGSLQFDRDQRDSSETAGGLTVSATGPVGFRWGDEGLEEPPHAPAFYTNHGTNAVDLGAPGGNADLDAVDSEAAWYRDFVPSTVAVPAYDEETGEYLGAQYGYDWFAGTSMAAPQVAGAAALVKSANPRYNANQVKNALQRAAAVPEEYDKKYYGSGYLDTYGAVTE